MVNAPEGNNPREIFTGILENAGKGLHTERLCGFERRLRLEYGADEGRRNPIGQAADLFDIAANRNAIHALPAFGNFTGKHAAITHAAAHFQALCHIGRATHPDAVAVFQREGEKPAVVLRFGRIFYGIARRILSGTAAQVALLQNQARKAALEHLFDVVELGSKIVEACRNPKSHVQQYRICYILHMADQNDKNIKTGETPENPQQENSQDKNAPDFAKLADAASPEGSSINSEDYWFLKLNGNC